MFWMSLKDKQKTHTNITNKKPIQTLQTKNPYKHYKQQQQNNVVECFFFLDTRSIGVYTRDVGGSNLVTRFPKQTTNNNEQRTTTNNNEQQRTTTNFFDVCFFFLRGKKPSREKKYICM
jgi:hypothetical protein